MRNAHNKVTGPEITSLSRHPVNLSPNGQAHREIQSPQYHGLGAAIFQHFVVILAAYITKVKILKSVQNLPILRSLF